MDITKQLLTYNAVRKTKLRKKFRMLDSDFVPPPRLEIKTDVLKNWKFVLSNLRTTHNGHYYWKGLKTHYSLDLGYVKAIYKMHFRLY